MRKVEVGSHISDKDVIGYLSRNWWPYTSKMGNRASIESKVEDKPISQILYLLAQELWSRNEENNSKVEQKKKRDFLKYFLREHQFYLWEGKI